MTLVRTTDPDEAAELIASGARLARYAHDMQRNLLDEDIPDWWRVPGLDPNLKLTLVDRPVADLAAASLSAYPPGHVDAAQAASMSEASAMYEGILTGHIAGPFIAGLSHLVIDATDDALVGAVLVTSLPASNWWAGGPWLCDLFVVPRHRGTGVGLGMLLMLVGACADHGHERLGLSVTDGNPAERLYKSVGFERRRSVFVLDAPDGT